MPPIDLFGMNTPYYNDTSERGAWKRNKMIDVYGKGPEGEVCKHCIHFIRKDSGYFKCKFRGDTNGAGTDHRANWPSCNRFKKQS